jgi:hypothetical protein
VTEKKIDTMNIKTKLLGELHVSISDGLLDDYTLVLGGKEVTFSLFIFDNFLTDETASATIRFIDNIPSLYEKARAEIKAQSADSAMIDYFVKDGLDCTDEDYEEYLLDLLEVDSVKEITKEMFLEALELRGLHICETKNDGVICVFDFSLDEEYTDELLVVAFNDVLEVIYITNES